SPRSGRERAVRARSASGGAEPDPRGGGDARRLSDGRARDGPMEDVTTLREVLGEETQVSELHVTTLCDVLGEETRVCELLVDTLRREQRAVVELRPEAVVACLTERHELGNALAGLAARRRAAAAALGDALDARGLPASALLPLLPP